MSAPLFTWLIEPLPLDVRQTVERLRQASDVVHVALMPDVHLSKDGCVGTVLATTHTLYPAAIGSDIGCGVATLRISDDPNVLDREEYAAALIRSLYERIPASRHRKPRELPIGLEVDLSNRALTKDVLREGRAQFGTLGSGNHFLEFQAADDGLWVMVHSGSRSMGESIRDWHLRGAETGLSALEAESPAGQAYLHDMGWALAFARASRRAMLEAAVAACGQFAGIAPQWQTLVDCHHNAVAHEEHSGRRLWVHRKGAIPAHEGEPGLIPGSMGAPSFHVQGRGCEQALCSCSHGAGRRMSRSEARHSISVGSFEEQMEGVWFDHRRARQLLEEAPGTYKDIGQVMRAQHDLTKVVQRLRPVLSYKGR